MHKDKPKLCLNIPILLDDSTEYGKLFQIAIACEKKRNKESSCKSGVRGCVCLVKWFVQGLYTRGAIGKSMDNLVQMTF